MKHRIYPLPFTRSNESWNPYGELNTQVSSDVYCDPVIETPYVSGSNFKFDNSFYKMIGVDIVTETIFDYPYPYTTEKTFRPFALKRMMILVGPANTLKFLKTKGFKTFSPFINEDYDAIVDPIKRMQAIQVEIKRLCTFTLDEIRKAMLQYESVLEHNFKLCLDIEHIELKTIKTKLDLL